MRKISSGPTPGRWRSETQLQRVVVDVVEHLREQEHVVVAGVEDPAEDLLDMRVDFWVAIVGGAAARDHPRAALPADVVAELLHQSLDFDSRDSRDPSLSIHYLRLPVKVPDTAPPATAIVPFMSVLRDTVPL